MVLFNFILNCLSRFSTYTKSLFTQGLNKTPKYNTYVRHYTSVKHDRELMDMCLLCNRNGTFTVTDVIELVHERLLVLYKVDTRVLDDSKLRRDLHDNGVCVRIRGDELYVLHSDGTETILPQLGGDEWQEHLRYGVQDDRPCEFIKKIE